MGNYSISVIFYGGSRTYLMIAMLLFRIIYYCFVRRNSGFWFRIIPIIIALTFVLMQATIGDKIISYVLYLF